jgi:hypothetical protein
VEECLRESGITEGLALVNAMHITAGVFINDDERGLHADYDEWLEGLAPHEPISRYRHNRTGEDNADAHMKRQIMGREVVVAITNGRLDGSALLTRAFWPVGAGILWRVRRATEETGVGQDHWGVTRSEGGNGWTSV